jgi:hypothetical protein
MTMKGLIWCQGCDELIHSDWMRWTKDGLYRCDVCRGVPQHQPIVVTATSSFDGMILVTIGGRTERMTEQQYRERYVT